MNTTPFPVEARTLLSASPSPRPPQRTRRSALRLLPVLCLLSSVLGPQPSALAASFSGKARVEISDPTGGLSWNSTSNALTVECWFKISIPSGITPKDEMTILDNREPGVTGQQHAYRIYWDDEKGNIQFSTRDLEKKLWAGELIPRSRFYLERWYHVAVVRNGNDLSAYVDGQSVTNTTITVDDSRSTHGVSIGGWGNAKYLYGEIQEVAIYQKALTLQMIQDRLFKDQREYEGLVGYYKLGYSTNSNDLYTNFAPSPPTETSPAVKAGAGQILFEETNRRGEQSLFDSMKNGGKNAVVPLSGAFVWQQSVFSRPAPGVPFDFSIAYSPGASSTLGPGWNHVFNSRVEPILGTSDWNVFTWQGGVETWDGVSDLGPFSTRHGEYRGELVRTNSADIEWTTPARLIYRYLSQNTTNGLAKGQLAEIRDLNGNSLQVRWNKDEGYITEVEDSVGGKYRFDRIYSNGQLLLTNVTYDDWQVRFDYTNMTLFDESRTLLASKTLTNTSGLYTNVAATWRFYYNTNNGLLEKIVDPRGNDSVRVGYDGYGRRVSTSNALGESTRMEYGAPGNRQIRTTDAAGYQWIDTYDRKGRVIVQRDPLGHETRYGYDEHGNRTAITDAKGNTTFLGYTNANVIAITNALGEITGRTYDLRFNKPLTQTDPLGWTTTNSYDAKGNLLAQSDALGTLATYTYNAKGQVLTATDANGHTSTNAYNTNGFVIAQTDAAGFTTHFEPNELGWNLTTRNALNETTTYAYDLNGKTVRTVDPLTRTYLATYDANGNLLTETDAKGKSNRYTYDALNRKIQEVDRAGGVTGIAYTPRGKPAAATNELGAVTRFEYDAANRQTAVVDALGNRTTTVYDANGNAVATIDPLGQRWSKGVDRLNRVVTEADPYGQAVQTVHDAAGRVSEMIAPDGSRTINAYDRRGRLTNWVDAAGSTWSYAYDGVGNITNITDALGGTYAMTYGPRDERILERNQDGKLWTYTYDALLRLKTQTEPNGTVRTLVYDSGGRLTNVTFSTGRQNAFSYDANDNPIVLSRSGSGPPDTSLLAYDVMDRVSRYTNTFGQTLRYEYDAAGRLTTLTYPGNKTLSHGYDDLDRLTDQVFHFSAGQTFTTSYAYDKAGQLIRRTYPNGIAQTNTFDAAGRLTGLSHAPLDPQPSTLNVALAYAYDRNGNTVRAGQRGNFQWPVPALRNETSRFTAAGRITNRWDALNPVTQNFNYHYDASGNMTNASGGGQTWCLTYDEDNRTAGVGWSVGALCDKQITNRYDALGRRVARTVDGVETRYVLDLAGGMERILCDVMPSGVILAWYVHGPDLAFKVNVEGGLNCYHADAQGNVIALTGADGVNFIEYVYTPYGRSLGSTNYLGQSSLNDQPFLFVGSQGVMEDLPGLYFMRARYYSAEAGVFLSTDPVKNIGPTWRPIAYVYVNGNPLSYTDPQGEFGLGGALLGAGIGALVNAGIDAAFQSIEQIGEHGWNPGDWQWDWQRTVGAGVEGAILGAVIGGTGGAGCPVGSSYLGTTGGAILGGALLGAGAAAAGKSTEIALKQGLDPHWGMDQFGEVGLSAFIGGFAGGLGSIHSDDIARLFPKKATRFSRAPSLGREPSLTPIPNNTQWADQATKKARNKQLKQSWWDLGKGSTYGQLLNKWGN